MSCKMKKIAFHILLAALLAVSCNKVSPIGVLVAGTAVEDRVAMSSCSIATTMKIRSGWWRKGTIPSWWAPTAT